MKQIRQAINNIAIIIASRFIARFYRSGRFVPRGKLDRQNERIVARLGCEHEQAAIKRDVTF